jgi:hypothetical protein
MLRAIRDHIIFTFVDEVRLRSGEMKQGGFIETTDWGFRMDQNHQLDTTKARPANVTHVGPEAADDVKVGDVILIEPTMWTTVFMYEGTPYWRTDLTKLIGIYEKEETSP